MRTALGVAILFGLGCSGGGAAAGLGQGGQLDRSATATLVVSPDEAHVAFLRDATSVEAGCMNRGAVLTTGTLVVLEVTAQGSSVARVVAEHVQAQSIAFSADSRGLVFMKDMDTCGVGTLETANANGTRVRVVHASVYYQRPVGGTVFFLVKDAEHPFAAHIGDGQTLSLATLGPAEEPSFEANPSGTAFADRKHKSDAQGGESVSVALVALPSGASRTLVDGSVEELGNTSWSTRGNWFLYCHRPRGATEPPALTLVATDGSARFDVSANSTCTSFAFSPDESWLAFGEPDASGGTSVVTYSLKEKRRVALGTVPPHWYLELAFSADGKSVLVGDETATSVGYRIYAGTTDLAGSLRYLVDMVGPLSNIACAGGHAAIPGGSGTVVYPVTAGDPVDLTGVEPQYEPGVSEPHLVARTWSDGTPPTSGIVVAATDGAALTTLVVPDYVAFHTWLGSAAVYGNHDGIGGPVTIRALTQAGAVETLLADQIATYAWAPIPAPKRLFYARPQANAGGPAGIFYADLSR
jgi:hypothetical protein